MFRNMLLKRKEKLPSIDFYPSHFPTGHWLPIRHSTGNAVNRPIAIRILRAAGESRHRAVRGYSGFDPQRPNSGLFCCDAQQCSRPTICQGSSI